MNESNRPQLGHLGMKLFLISLSVLFGASLVAILIIRSRSVTWPPEGAPALPSGLWLSTALILVSSWILALGQRRARRDKAAAAFPFLVACLLLALAFFVNQIFNWVALAPVFRLRNVALYAFSFFTLTVLHAVHLVGGVISLGVVAMKASQGILLPQAMAHAAMYWHFLTAVWLVIFLVLKIFF